MRNIKIELGENSYPVFISREPFEKFAELLRLYGFNDPIVIVTDTNVSELYGIALKEALGKSAASIDMFTMPAGEKNKTLKTAEKLLSHLLERQFNKKLILVALGGGIVGDLTGFVASVFKRGVRFIQVPTTLLAQVDASIGGKTAVNHSFGKNQIGTFYQPKLVWSSLTVLGSLPKKEIICGLGEIIKYGVIADENLFTLVNEKLSAIFNCDPDLLEEIVYACSEVKAKIVEKDEKEKNIRMILNFGHTVGHALETAMNYKRISHGEAVLYGMLAESKIAVDSGLMAKPDFNRIKNLLIELALKPKFNASVERIMECMWADKKITSDKIRMILPKRIGDVLIVDDVDKKRIRSGLKYLFSVYQ